MTKIWKILFIILLLCLAYVGYKALDYRAHVNVYLDKYIRAVDELARREVYAEANAALVSDTTVNNRVVFFGTQVVSNWKIENLFPGFETINRGVDGQRAAGLLLRFRPDVVELSPEAVVIQISSYNFRPQNKSDDIFSYTIELIDMAVCHDIYPLVSTVITPSKEILDIDTEIINSSYNIRDTIEVFNNRLIEYCQVNGYTVLDFNAVLADDDGFLRHEFAGSAIIPNDHGYALLQELTYVEMLPLKLSDSVR